MIFIKLGKLIYDKLHLKLIHKLFYNFLLEKNN